MEGFILIAFLGIVGVILGVCIAFFDIIEGLVILVLGFCLSFVSFDYAYHLYKNNC